MFDYLNYYLNNYGLLVYPCIFVSWYLFIHHTTFGKKIRDWVVDHVRI